MVDVSRETPPVPDAARGVFADRLGLAVRYAELLSDAGVVRGLIGPREVPRIWDRHILNCAVVADLIPQSSTVADVGSGAGLPGLVLAIRRPDLGLTLIEPLLRRTTFLEEAVDELGLANVEVFRGRADDLHGKRKFDAVTSRAVAPLGKLAKWSLPLVRTGGTFVPMKGSSASEELVAARAEIKALGGRDARVRTLSMEAGAAPVTVVEILAGK